MKAPRTSPFKLEDFPGAEAWLGKLLQGLNQVLQPVSAALEKQLTFEDNFAGQEILLDVTYQSSSDFPRYFKLTGARPREVRLCEASEDGLPVWAAMPWTVDEQNRLRIETPTLLKAGAASALSTGKRYIFRLRTGP